jgi:glycosyltransferase involved in cell wall biosynthesis
MTFALVVTNLRGGGAERAILRVAEVLARHEHRVEVILLEHRIEHDVPAGIALHALTAPGVPLGKGFFGKRLAAVALRRLYSRLGLSTECITVSTLPFTDEVVMLARIPNAWHRIANTLSAEIEQLARSNPGKAARRAARYRRLYGGKNLVAVSQGVADDLRRSLGLDSARIVRIYNGFDFAAIQRAAREPGAADLPSGPFVLHVGRFMPQKRHDVLLDAWRQAALPCRLVLMTHEDPVLDEMITARGLREQVVVVGFRRNPYPWMRAAQILVLCSDREGMPNVLVEALACGTRVISTDCPSGPREVLRGDLARWLVPCGRADALAAAMRAALSAPPPEAAAILEDFTEERMARAYEALAEAA